MGHHEKQAGQEKAGPAHEVETLLAALADAGRDLGPELAYHLSKTLAPLCRRVRSELVAVIDDAFEVAPDLEAARRQGHLMLRNAQALEAAKAVWPAYPEPPAPTEAPAASHVEPPWLAYIERHCELAPDDTRYVIRHLSLRSEAEAMQLARRYVEAWATGADAEPQAHRCANAGRRAANAMLRGATP
ncbi:hypothetical protein ACR80S_04880 [Halomonas sp. MA07-2]|uniref:hypothetical protein n=1 Tax=Halomonas sp. MA07-2 TaxID=3440841 RepID=UPI003EEF1004